jgi:hypothetical protein
MSAGTVGGMAPSTREKVQMKGSRARVSGVVVIAVVMFGMVATVLHAGPAASGRFKLPFDAQMGMMALPTGNYSYTVDGLSLDGKIVVYRENQALGILRAQTFSENGNQSKNPALLCIRHDGKVAIRALRLPRVGTFYFSLPKDLNVLMAQQPQLIETVSIEVSGD